MNTSVLSISGPIMTGPSSSHTAGALKIGRLALQINDKPIKKVRIYLHGSFASVYKGHATDKAILGGLMGLSTDSKEIKNAYQIAEKSELSYKFIKTDLGEKYHPNTVRIEILDEEKPLIITASSIGGGAIVLKGINNFYLNFKEPLGNTYSIIILHKDSAGVINNLTKMLTTTNNNIASIHSERKEKGGDALTIIETDEKLDNKIFSEMKLSKNIYSVFIMK